jgi:hypothetical protein
VAITAGQKLRVSDLTGTSSGGSGGVTGGNTVRMAGDVTVNNTTSLTDMTGLSVAVVAGATYKFDAWVMYTSLSTPDFKIQPSSPASTVGYWSLAGYGRDVAPAADTGLGGVHIVADIATSLTVAGDATGTLRMACRAAGYFTTVGAGTFVLRMGQRTANASNTVARTGSWLDVVRIA